MKHSVYHRRLTAAGNGGFLISLPPEWTKHPMFRPVRTVSVSYLKSGELEIVPDAVQGQYAIINRRDRPNCARVYVPKEWITRNGYQKGDEVKMECYTSRSEVFIRLAPNG